jgi:hypothetical protein
VKMVQFPEANGATFSNFLISARFSGKRSSSPYPWRVFPSSSLLTIFLTVPEFNVDFARMGRVNLMWD